ncbi:sensor histidine kinase [Nocardioides insulae]|uniref:sensor histidine kinase n=1 Tax=Nocardioides insulae TaxID=394734 RepID=UPI00042A6096|nr:histidine kinase [Nocardioides insulae]
MRSLRSTGAPAHSSPWLADALLADLLLGVVLAVVAEVELALLDPTQVDGSLVVHQVMILLIVPATAIRRVWPLGSIVVSSLGFAVEPLAGTAPTATPFLVLLFLLGSLGWYAGTRTGALGVVLVLVGGLGHDVWSGDVRAADAVVNIAIIVAAWGALHLLRRMSDRRVAAELDADRRARAAVEEERTRIAQDLHDSLAHALTLITLQAGSARERAEQALVADSLASIERTGREAIADMHRFLGLLGPREGEAPGLAHLPDLAASVRGGGLAVDLVVEPPVAECDIPASVSTTVYRIVQEALTNVVRHSDARVAKVRVCRAADDLVTVVADDGHRRTPRTAGSGRGLDGLRRRVMLFDGSLAAGETSDGWRVEARIPLVAGRP